MKTKYFIKKILRKIYHFIGFISIFFVFVNSSYAETIVIYPLGNSVSDTPTTSSVNYLYNTVIPNYSSSYSDYIVTYFYDTVKGYWALNVDFFNKSSSDTLDFTQNFSNISLIYHSPNSSVSCVISSTGQSSTCNTYSSLNINLIIADSGNGYGIRYALYDSSINFTTTSSIVFSHFYSDNIELLFGDKYPFLKNLFNYTSWADYSSNFEVNYNIVNLDNFDYVLLTLKNYNQSVAFETQLQVLGQIGITPIYNYGQTSKDSITGVQVQDRCNATYSSFTPFSLYILQSDLQNNVIYAIKSCLSGSSFKYDTSIFDITYVTQQNVSDPIVTINGQQYHTIPYNDLPSTATKNESDNYIPGESYNFVDSGIDSLNSALKQSSNWLSSIWSTITYFTQFIGLIFSSLPSELHAILLSAFIITIIIGLIKHFTS